MDNKLPSWDELAKRFCNSAILIGNGQSRAVSNDYGYESLYETARKHINESHRLTDTEINVFEKFSTSNFERVLRSLWTTRQTLKALVPNNSTTKQVQGSYDRIRHSLIEAIRANHCHQRDLPDQTLASIGEELMNYKWVFTTNYDLICYWSLMHYRQVPCLRSHLEDFFRPADSGDLEFHEREADSSASEDYKTNIVYLHGALHLLRHEGEKVTKFRYEQGEPILHQLKLAMGKGTVPLFVSEGTCQDKRRAIRSSNYLSFAMKQFESYNGDLVVFGHGLDENDQHIVDAIQATKDRAVAVSIFPAEGLDIEARKREIQGRLSQLKRPIHFFNSQTHPLGDPQLSEDARRVGARDIL